MRILPGYVRAIPDNTLRRVLLDNLAHEANYTLGICEQLRFIYDSVYQLPEGEIKTVIIDQLIDAFAMAKKMGSRLNYYKRKYNDKSGHGGANLIKLLGTNKRRAYRRIKHL